MSGLTSTDLDFLIFETKMIITSIYSIVSIKISFKELKTVPGRSKSSASDIIIILYCCCYCYYFPCYFASSLLAGISQSSVISKEHLEQSWMSEHVREKMT